MGYIDMDKIKSKKAKKQCKSCERLYARLNKEGLCPSCQEYEEYQSTLPGVSILRK